MNINLHNYTTTRSTFCFSSIFADKPRKAGRGKGRIARWGRRAATRYTHCLTGKDNLRGWLYEIGKEDSEECRWCRGMRSSSARRCGDRRGDKRWTVLVPKAGGKGEVEEWDLVSLVKDLVEEFFSGIRIRVEEEEDG